MTGWLRVKKLRDSAGELNKSHTGDAGYDLVVSERTFIPAGGFADVPTGLSVQLPDGYWGLLTGRSSTLRRRSLLVAQGIIDNGYRGELYAGVWNLHHGHGQWAEPGERLAQLIVLPVWAGAVSLVTELSGSSRGINGFGSTGV